MPDSELLEILDNVMAQSNTNIDSRLIAVLKDADIEDVDIATSSISLTKIAKQHGLSTSRLRSLTRDQVGESLSTLI